MSLKEEDEQARNSIERDRYDEERKQSRTEAIMRRRDPAENLLDLADPALNRLLHEGEYSGGGGRRIRPVAQRLGRLSEGL